MCISKQVIDTLIYWIDNNLRKPLSIQSIAVYSGYSKRHLQRLFIQHAGESIGRYIRNRRLQKAAEDLCVSDECVKVICLRYGFTSQQSFTHTFVKKFRQTPGSYREQRSTTEL